MFCASFGMIAAMFCHLCTFGRVCASRLERGALSCFCIRCHFTHSRALGRPRWAPAERASERTRAVRTTRLIQAGTGRCVRGAAGLRNTGLGSPLYTRYGILHPSPIRVRGCTLRSGDALLAREAYWREGGLLEGASHLPTALPFVQERPHIDWPHALLLYLTKTLKCLVDCISCPSCDDA